MPQDDLIILLPVLSFFCPFQEFIVSCLEYHTLLYTWSDKTFLLQNYLGYTDTVNLYCLVAPFLYNMTRITTP